MSKLRMALIGGCLSLAVAGAHAATGSPADSDKAGRMGPGTAAGQAGASDPTPGKAGATTGTAARSGTGASSTGATGTGTSTSTTTGASAGTSSTGASATVTTDGPRTTRTRRAARASRG